MAHGQSRDGNTGEAVGTTGGSSPEGPRLGMALVVFIGGALGTWLRWVLGGIAAPIGGFHPGTFLANMLACTGYAFLTSYLAARTDIARQRRDYTGRALGMGLCGGLSTMSTMVVEVIQDVMEGHILGSLVYLLSSFILALALAAVMAELGQTAAGRRAHGTSAGDSR